MRKRNVIDGKTRLMLNAMRRGLAWFTRSLWAKIALLYAPLVARPETIPIIWHQYSAQIVVIVAYMAILLLLKGLFEKQQSAVFQASDLTLSYTQTSR
jgi:hypothetical protein